MKYHSNKPSLTNTSKQTLGLIYLFTKEPKGRGLQSWGLLFTFGQSPVQRKYIFWDLTDSEKNKL